MSKRKLSKKNEWKAWVLLLAAAISLWFPMGLLAGDVPPQLASLIESSCLDCHDSFTKEGDLDLQSLTFNLNDRDVAGLWIKIHDRVAAGEMPPADTEQPSPEVTDAFMAHLMAELIASETSRVAAEGRSTVRRLSRDEHINALRDLLKMPYLTAGDKLPPDSLSDGFGKSSSALPFSHVQMDRYLEVADHAIREAIAPQWQRPESKLTRVWVSDYQGETTTLKKGTPKERQTLRLVNDSPFLYLPLKEGDGMPIVNREMDQSFENFPGNFSKRLPGTVVDKKPFIDAVGLHDHGDQRLGKGFKPTIGGRYKLRIGAYAYRSNRGRVEPTERTEVIAVFGGDRLLGTLDVTFDSPVQEMDIWLNAGDELRVSAASLPLWRIEIGQKGERYLAVDVPAVAFQGFELEGPIVAQWPPESHRRLFGALPMREGTNGAYEVVSESPLQDARRLLASFMAEAYRRDVRETDFDIPIEALQRRLGDGASFQDAMIAAYTSVLSSPHFILVPMSPGSLSADELVNRLSLFLWNAPADAALRATKGEIDRGLIDRMMDDPRSNRFVDHFTDHWLDLRNIGVTEPDENLYNGYSPWLLESMRMETRAFFREMLRKDLPARTVIDSDFVMVNGILAELYGIDGVAGGHVRLVDLEKDASSDSDLGSVQSAASTECSEKHLRGGFLTQASVLKVSANGTTTSPVVRGVYVMDRLLGDPLPPPPEAVPAVEPDLSGATTIRQQLAKHRADAACATCHQKIDPPGFALESFDVMGRYRTRYHSLEQGDAVEGMNRRARPIQYKLALPVDSSGELPSGEPFEDIEEFRRLLLRDERALARNLLERLVVYATGAPVSFADRKQVERILDQTADTDYGLRSMIDRLVESPLFLRK